MSDEERASLLSKMNALQWVVGGLCACLLAVTIAAVPWAFMVQSDLSSIKTTLASLATIEIPPQWFKDDVEENTRKILELERRIQTLERSN